jgi:carbamoyltransferase
MKSALLGPEFSNDQIEKFLKISKVSYRKSENICKETAQFLSKGMIIGWYQSRMEFGPRALGSRSILADPTNPKMKDRINSYVKFREEFRPFTPSVKSESASIYFNLDFISRFMLFVFPVRDKYKEKLPAITHVDGTARVQCVDKSIQPKYWKLLDEFEKIKDFPVLLNTSFNIMGEPIVYSPDQAIRCFYGSGIDTLIIGDFIVEKNEKNNS